MSFVSIGDLSQSLQLRRDNARLNADLARLSSELSSGRNADLREAEKGDLRPLAAIERTVVLLEGYRTAVREAALFAETAQATLATLDASADELMGNLLLARTAGLPAQIDAVGATAAAAFESAVARLNVQVAGRTVFAGTATDRPALAPAKDILDAVEVAAAGATTAADVEVALDTWFAAGGGFDTMAYLGSDALRPFRLSDGDTATLNLTAEAPELRATLKGMATAALLDRGILAAVPGERGALAGRAAEALLPARDGVIALRAGVGDAEAAIERSRVRVEVESSTAEVARAGIVAADPFVAAAELQSVQVQLESLYAVTARLSSLNLAAYLR